MSGYVRFRQGVYHDFKYFFCLIEIDALEASEFPTAMGLVFSSVGFGLGPPMGPPKMVSGTHTIPLGL